MTATLTIEDPTYFDRLAEVEVAHWWSLGIWRLSASWLATALRGRRGLRALDVGCGTGLTVARLAGRPEFAEVVGVEPSAAALSWASRRGHPWVRGSALALPFAAGRFDLVTCLDVLQHLPDGRDRDAAAELRRVLRPGGFALIRSNARGWSPGPAQGGALYDLPGLIAVLESSGLRVRRATYANCLPALLQELRGRLRPGPSPTGTRRGHPAGRGLRIRVPHPIVNRLLGGVASAEAVVAGRLGTSLPFGHSTLALAERCR